MKHVDTYSMEAGKWYCLYTNHTFGTQWCFLIQAIKGMNVSGTYDLNIKDSYYFYANNVSSVTDDLAHSLMELKNHTEVFELTEEEFLKHIIADEL